MKRRLLSLILGFGLLVGMAAPTGLSVAQSGNCDPNDIIACGAFSVDELRGKLDEDNVRGIFAHYGIHESDFGNLVEGTVHQNGEVRVGNEVVATGAVSTGRHDMPGSTHVPALNIYERPTSVSFRSASIPSFVMMDENNQFKYAIIKNCGNPVRANPIPVEEPPEEEPPEEEPPEVIEGNVVCESLRVEEHIKRNKFRFLAQTAGNDFEVERYEFDFGDGNTEVIDSSSFNARATHEYDSPGNYTVRVAITARVQGEDVDEVNVVTRHCQVSVTVEDKPEVVEEEPEKEVVKIKKPVKKIVKIEKPVEKIVKVEKPVKEVVKVEKPVEEVQQPKPAVLPDTGAGGVVGAAAASTSLAGYVSSLVFQAVRRRW